MSDQVTTRFVGKWARGLHLAMRRLARAGYTPSDAEQLVADLVVDVLGEDFLNLATLQQAVSVAKPDPLAPRPA